MWYDIDHEENINMEREEPEEQSIQEKPSDHEENIYVEKEEPEEQSIQEKLSDHEEYIFVEKEEPEEQSIQEKPSDHEEYIYVEREEPEEQSIQEKPSDHEKDINMEREEPEEQSIQEKTSAETSIQKNNAKDESSEENETVVTLCSRVQYRECLFRLHSLVIDVGTDVLRNIFDQKLQGVALDVFLANEIENLENLKQQKAITIAQFNLLYPPDGQSSNSAEFDITLILCLLRYLPSLISNEVVAYIEPDLCRLCKIMDKIFRTSWTGSVEQSFFNTIKTDIEEVLLRLNATVPKPLADLNEKIKRYDNKTLDPATERRNKTIFNQWWDMEYEYVIPHRPLRAEIPEKRQDFGDINPKVTIQNVEKIDRIGGFRSVIEEKQQTQHDVTSIMKDFNFIVADLKSITTEVVTISSRVQYRECLFHLQSLVIDVGTDVLRNIFYQSLQGVALDAFLANEMEDIKYLKQQKVITKAQFKLLYPPCGQSSNIAEFDITLILCLLQHLPSLRFNDFYKCTQPPMPVVVSVGTDIRRLCDIMTEIVRLTRRFQSLYFNTIKTDIEQVLLRLNATVPKPLANLNVRIKRCENKTLDPAAEQRNQDIFDLWEQIQFTSVIRLRPIRTMVSKKRQDVGDINPLVTIQNVKKIDRIGGSRRDIKQYIEQDVTFINKDIQSLVTEDHEDDIFTEREESAEQSIQEKPSEDIVWNIVQNQKSVSRLQSLVIDVGTDVLRNIFDQRLQGVALDAFLANEMENLENLKQQKAITNAQFNLLYPPDGQPSNIAEFDITLILCLLQHLPSLRFNEFYKSIQWPMSVDVAESVEPDIRRLCDIMTEIVRSPWFGRFHQSSFNTIKTDIEEVLLRLNATIPKPLANLNERIKGYENKTLDPAARKRNQKIFNQWEHMWLTPVIPLKPSRTRSPKKRHDFGDMNPQVTIQNVKKIHMFGGFKGVMDEKQYIEQDVISRKNDFKSIEADLKSIKTKEIVLSNRECLFRLQCLVIDVGTDVLRNLFDQRLHGMTLNDFLANEMEHLKILKLQKTITKAQFNLLYPPGGQPSNIAEFDSTLILLLLRYLPSVGAHDVSNYLFLPTPMAASIDTNLCRLCDIMDEIVRLTRRFQPLYFHTIKTEIEKVLLRLNNTLEEPLANIYERIEKCETKTLDPAAEQRNQDIFYQWELIQFAPLIHLRPTRTKVPKKRQDFGDINPQVTIQNVKKVDLFGGFRSEMGQKQYVKQDVTSIKKDLKTIEADLKSIKTEDIEHGVSKGNEAEST